MIQVFWKDIKIFFSDPKAILLTFLLPILLITFFVFAYGGIGSKEKKAQPIRLLLSDLDQSDVSRQLFVSLDTLKSVSVQKVEFKEGENLVKRGKAPVLLVFNAGLNDSLKTGGKVDLDIYYDKSNEIQVGLLQQAIAGRLFSVLGSKMIEPKVLKNIESQYVHLPENVLNGIRNQVKSDFANEGQIGGIGENLKFNLKEVIKKKKNSWGLIHAVAGVAVMMLLFSVTAMGSSILSEKESGTLKRLIASPLSPIHILLGKYLYTIFVAILQLSIMFLFANLVFGLEIFEHILQVLLMIIATSFACASFGMFLASICKTRKQVDGLSILIILLMSAIGGSMIPLVFMPAIMKQLAVISVNYWSIQGFYDIFWRGLAWGEIAMKAGVLFFIAFVLMSLSVFFFRKNILKLN